MWGATAMLRQMVRNGARDHLLARFSSCGLAGFKGWNDILQQNSKVHRGRISPCRCEFIRQRSSRR
jgi:hypothetical protein